MSGLEVRLRKQLSREFALDVAFAAPSGITMLFGRSGAGKSSTLQSIAGLLQPDEGRIALGGRVLFDSGTRTDVPVHRRGAGYLFQHLALFPHMNVGANVAYGLARLPPKKRERRVAESLASFGISHLESAYPRSLSGGERQRVALARALVTDPQLLLLDEPMSALDRQTKSLILTDLRKWNERRQAPILYVAHDREEVFALGERIVVVEAGRVVAEGTPQQVLEAPRAELLAQLSGYENLLEATVAEIRPGDGTMLCRISPALNLEVPLTNTQPGAPVRIAIRAGDILLATERPDAISARNMIPGRVRSIEAASSGSLVHVEADGVGLTVRVTNSSARALGLADQREVWCVIKTYSCHPVV